jgi:CrcB protein
MRSEHHRSTPPEWPVDTDVSVDDLAAAADPRTQHTAGVDAGRTAAVAVGGFAGGLVRYEVVHHWTLAASAFPWPILVVNTAGAFVLALVVILVIEVLRPTRYLRPLLGTGFCGGLTTFSSVAVGIDVLAGHGHSAMAASYAVSSLLAGLAATALGVAAARLVAR